MSVSLSQYGITWLISGNPTTGSYVNGDYWVVGPVNITGIFPISENLNRPLSPAGSGTGIVNGSMLNPIASNNAQQGLDSLLNGGGSYRSALNIARPNGSAIGENNPLYVVSGSIVSSISNITGLARPALTDAAVLTIVNQAPSTGSFRPPYCGTGKSHHWNMTGINYGAFQSLPTVSSAPSLSTVAGYFQRPWIEIDTEANGRYYHPSNNQPDYGRDTSWLVEEAVLSLQLNYTNEQKNPLLIRTLQYGIDIYGAANTNGNWSANGGHDMGRKMPMLMAGLAFNDPNILRFADKAQNFIFQEDQQTFYVAASDVQLARYSGDGRTRDPYTSGMIGLPEWGEKHSFQPDRDGSNWDVLYRNVNYSSLLGHCLAARLMNGGMAAWNWPVFFDYHDRVRTIAASGEFQPFTNQMWNEYRYYGSSVRLKRLGRRLKFKGLSSN